MGWAKDTINAYKHKIKGENEIHNYKHIIKRGEYEEHQNTREMEQG